MAIAFTQETRVLFIGDSITDCGRTADPQGLGHGYVRLIFETLLARDPATAPTIINRGISGNCVPDLVGRWDRDVLAHEPDVVSIKIGINDVWRQMDSRGGVLIDDFRRLYDQVLSRTLSALPACKLVLCEPTVFWPPAVDAERGQALIKPYVQAVNDLAADFAVHAVVPLHDAFNDARAARPDVDWASDGVHPSSAGHMLITHHWLNAI
jgi:acyl-CoA thioesterase I